VCVSALALEVRYYTCTYIHLCRAAVMLSSTDLSVEVCAERRAADAVGGEGAQCFTLSNADGRRRQRRLAGTDADKNADTDAAAVQVTPISACLGTPAASIPGVNPSLPVEGVRSPHCTQDQP